MIVYCPWTPLTAALTFPAFLYTDLFTYQAIYFKGDTDELRRCSTTSEKTILALPKIHPILYHVIQHAFHLQVTLTRGSPSIIRSAFVRSRRII